MDFQYNLPVNLIFGRGKISGAGTQTALYGKKALVVTGRNSTKRTGLLDKTLRLLRAAGVEAVVFDQVDPNPLTTTAYAGAKVAVESRCDVVFGLGGGSILDAAKAIAFCARNEGPVDDFIFGRKSSLFALPLILVPTTCGTGSEGNGFSVLTNPVTKDKKSLRCNAIIAKASIIDPEVMTTMPKDVLASVGFDALCHNMEAYLSSIGQPISTALALQGISLVAESLPAVYGNYANMDAWEKLALGSTFGGMVINVAGIAAPHGMEHPASGLKDIVHGKGLAALTPVIYEESIASAPEKFTTIARLLGGKTGADCVSKIRELLKFIHLECTLGDLGIGEGDVEWMTENCLKVSAAGIANSPRVFDRGTIERIYRKAL